MAVIADLGRLADDDAHAVVDEQPLADPGARVDLDPREEPSDVRHEPRHDGHTPLVQGVRQAVELSRVEAGIGEDDFQVAGRGRVLPPRGANITNNAIEDGHCALRIC